MRCIVCALILLMLRSHPVRVHVQSRDPDKQGSVPAMGRCWANVADVGPASPYRISRMAVKNAVEEV